MAIVGASEALKQVLALADAVAHNDCVVLIEGESGTGKELIARRIHVHSQRASMPFIPVNCPGISQSLFESQFYGHVKGAFTGATTDTLGVVRAAEGGTLMLDEIGELAMEMQPKLLRLLQEQEVTPVGATRPVPANARVIAATNRDLNQCVRDGTFRSDLYHRLNIVRIILPPLRQRPEDVRPLLDFYLTHYAAEYGMVPRQLSPRLYDMLEQYPWPGNVRELAAYIERLYATRQPPMPPGIEQWDHGHQPAPHPAPTPPTRIIHAFPDEGPSLPHSYIPSRQPLARHDTPAPPSRLPAQFRTLAQVEADAIREALQVTRYNRTAAARLLDIHRSTLIRKMHQLGLDSPATD